MMIQSPVKPVQRTVCVAVVGNPNTGKSTLFNALTGFRQRVGNYPGVTVDKKMGRLVGSPADCAIELLDLPGAYTLTHDSAADDAITVAVLLGRQTGAPRPDVVLCVADASNLRRNLFLASQVLELGRPVVVALTMTDVARREGLVIDIEALRRELGVPVVPVVATRGEGVEALRQALIAAVAAPPPAHRPGLPSCICAELDCLSESSRPPGSRRGAANHPDSRRGAADYPDSRRGAASHPAANYPAPCRIELLHMLLSGSNGSAAGSARASAIGREGDNGLALKVGQCRRRIEAAGESLVQVEARVRYAWINDVLARAVTRPARLGRTITDKVDALLTHRLVGMVVLMLLFGAVFQSIYAWAAPLMDLIDAAFGWVGGAVEAAVPPGALRSLLVDGVVAGVGGMLTFLPQIVILFLCLALLEDCGYLARAAYLLDRYLRPFGLSGKSFIPLLSSFACAVPGILATRSIEDRRDRLITIVVAPLMSCSARLPVYVLLIAVFVPPVSILGGLVRVQALTMLAMYALGVVTAAGVAWVLRRSMVKGPSMPFMLELPNYTWPSVKTVLYRAYEAGREFVRTAGTVIVAASIVIWAMAYYPRPASVAASFDGQRAAAKQVFEERVAADNDKAQRLLESELDDIQRAQDGAYLRQSVLGRMGLWFEPAVKPLGWDWRIGTAVIAAFPAREVVISTMATLYNLGGDATEESSALRSAIKGATWPDGRPVFNLAVALSLMAFFALCCQCVSTLAVIRRETKSWRWPVFAFTYMTALAYVVALLTYQVAIRV